MGRKIMEVGAPFFAQFFQQGRRFHYGIDRDGLPKDASLLRVDSDIFTGCILLLFESSEWPEVQPGSCYSRFSPKIRIYYEDSPEGFPEVTLFAK